MIRLLICTLCLLTLALPASAAGNLYRFKVDGRIVIKDYVPSDLAPLGYEVLNSRGMVVDVVPRELTAAEIAERERQLAAQKALDERIEKRRKQDMDILRQYASSADIERALQRKLDDAQSQITQQELLQQDLRNKLEQQQERAAGYERNGQAVPDSLRVDIERLQIGLKDIEQGIARRQEGIATLKQEFDQLFYRFRVLKVYKPGILPENVDEQSLPADPRESTDQ